MGMLSDAELVSAMAINIEQHDFKINCDKYIINKDTGMAFVREYKRLMQENSDLKKRIEANKFLGSI